MTRHVFTVEEILHFPDDYHTKGVLSLPYGDIVEPFEAWYSKTKKMSRVDYYNGKINCSIFDKRWRKCFLAAMDSGQRDNRPTERLCNPFPPT